MDPTQILPLTETVTPADQAAVAEVVGRAFESGAPVYPVGGGTSLDYGVRPTEPGLGLSLGRLARVVDYPARDLTITIEAGVTLAALAEQLASERQRLPVDVPQADRATVGGVVATSPSGPRRFRCGTMRDYVIGIRAIDGEGTAFSSGGRVVKNAAGYDLSRLVTGSLGTLGVITQVTLMVKPIPETTALVACTVADFDTAERLLDDLVHTPTLPAAIEFLAGPAWNDEPTLPPLPGGAAGRLVVGFEGTLAEVRWMVEQLQRQWRESGVSSPSTIDGESADRLWSRLTEFPAEQTAREAGHEESRPVTAQVSLLPSATIDFIQLLRQVDADCSIQAHAGEGVIRVRFSLPPDEVAALLGDRLRSAAAAAGARLVVLCCPGGGRWNQRAVWGPVAEGAAVMQAIKNQFDPKGILNPGRSAYGNR